MINFNNVKKVFLSCILIFVLCFSLSAQVAADPNDTFYDDALCWELQGLIPSLPEMRPYSLQLVKNILETVMNCDDYEAATEAKNYYEKYFGKALRFGLGTSFYGAASDDFQKQVDVTPIINGNAEVLKNTTISFEVTPLLSTGDKNSEVLPKYVAPDLDYESDDLSVGGLNLYTPYNAVAAYGTKDVYFQAGLQRNSFGSMVDTGIVLGATAPHVGSLVFTINKEKFNYQMAMLLLSASNSKGEGSYPSKYFYLHSLRYSFTEKFDFTVYETAITGPRFDFTYLMPIVPFMAMQQISGYDNDNLLLGVEFSFKPAKGVNIFANVLADDIGFNDLVKLQFNTKLKFALETGIQYAPTGENLCKFLAVDYTFLAPYMYTHSMEDAAGNLDVSMPNYQNYTSSKVSLGSTLSPNSDRLRFSIKVQPVKGLNLNFLSSVVRHGNINETLYMNGLNKEKTAIANEGAFDCVRQYLMYDCGSVTDGSIFDFPDAGKRGGEGDDAYFTYVNHNFLFLEKTTNYVCVQNTINAEYTYTLKNKSYFVFGLSYTLQQEKNVGVDKSMFTYDAELSADENKPTDEEIIAELNKQYEAWKAGLHNQWSNFFSVSVKYIF